MLSQRFIMSADEKEESKEYVTGGIERGVPVKLPAPFRQLTILSETAEKTLTLALGEDRQTVFFLEWLKNGFRRSLSFHKVIEIMEGGIQSLVRVNDTSFLLYQRDAHTTVILSLYKYSIAPTGLYQLEKLATGVLGKLGPLLPFKYDCPGLMIFQYPQDQLSELAVNQNKNTYFVSVAEEKINVINLGKMETIIKCSSLSGDNACEFLTFKYSDDTTSYYRDITYWNVVLAGEAKPVPTKLNGRVGVEPGPERIACLKDHIFLLDEVDHAAALHLVDKKTGVFLKTWDKNNFPLLANSNVNLNVIIADPSANRVFLRLGTTLVCLTVPADDPVNIQIKCLSTEQFPALLNFKNQVTLSIEKNNLIISTTMQHNVAGCFSSSRAYQPRHLVVDLASFSAVSYDFTDFDATLAIGVAFPKPQVPFALDADNLLFINEAGGLLTATAGKVSHAVSSEQRPTKAVGKVSVFSFLRSSDNLAVGDDDPVGYVQAAPLLWEMKPS